MEWLWQARVRCGVFTGRGDLSGLGSRVGRGSGFGFSSWAWSRFCCRSVVVVVVVVPSEVKGSFLG